MQVLPVSIFSFNYKMYCFLKIFLILKMCKFFDLILSGSYPTDICISMFENLGTRIFIVP